MAMHAQLQIRQNAQEMQEYMKDLFEWEKSLKSREAASRAQAGGAAPAAMPAVRGRVADSAISAPSLELQRPAVNPTSASGGAYRSSLKPRVAKPTSTRAASGSTAASHTHANYKKWDTFDVDKALESDGEEDEAAAQGTSSASKKPKAVSFSAQPLPPAHVPASTLLTPPTVEQHLTALRTTTIPSAAAPLAEPATSTLPPVRNSEPQDAEGWRKRGNDLFKIGQFSSARECYSRSILMEPDGCLGYANRAMAAIKLSDWAAAEEDCTQALSCDTSYVKAWHRRGAARRQLGRFLEAAEDFEAALRLEPTSSVMMADRDVCLADFMRAEKLQHTTRRTQLKVTVAAPATAAAAAAPSAAPAAAAAAPAAAPAETTCSGRELNDVACTNGGISTTGSSATAEPSAQSRASAQPKLLQATVASAAELLQRRFQSGQVEEPVPTTSTEFESSWRRKRDDAPSQRVAYLQRIRPASLPAVFKTSLTAPLLLSIVEVLLTGVAATAAQPSPSSTSIHGGPAGVADSAASPEGDRGSRPAGTATTYAAFVVEFLQHLSQVARFDMTAMSVPSRDKARLQPLWEALAAAVADSGTCSAEVLTALRKKYRLA